MGTSYVWPYKWQWSQGCEPLPHRRHPNHKIFEENPGVSMRQVATELHIAREPCRGCSCTHTAYSDSRVISLPTLQHKRLCRCFVPASISFVSPPFRRGTIWKRRHHKFSQLGQRASLVSFSLVASNILALMFNKVLFVSV
jgi:hypothetical protein